MTNKRPLIFAILILLGLLCLRLVRPGLGTKAALAFRFKLSMPEKSFTLDYRLISNEPISFSLSPKDSDTIHNHNLLDQIIGTLVKYGPSGRIEPYLAESWNESNDHKVWSFKMRSGLTCEDGSAISAESYVKTLTRQLKIYSQWSTLLTFDRLKGWEAFASGRTDKISGLYSEGNSVRMEFSKYPEGLLELLQMVYFGHWCPSNFSGHGDWGAHDKVVSSGPYQLTDFGDGHTITLSAREGWFSLSEASPTRIVFSSGPMDSLKDRKEPTVAYTGTTIPEEIPDGFHLVRSMPTWLLAIVLNAKRPNLFTKKLNRQKFHSNLVQILKSNPIDSLSLQPTRAFYPDRLEGSQINDMDEGFHFEKSAIQRPLVFNSLKTVAESDMNYIADVIRKSLPKEIRVEFKSVDRTRKDWLERYYDMEELDGRLQLVDTGGDFLSAAIRMMFCTKLGVRFPDSSGKICELVDEIDEGFSGPIEPYIKRFNILLNDESEVIPIFSTGVFWLYSKELDSATISPIPLDPRLDLLHKAGGG
jgi:hypothetical protein